MTRYTIKLRPGGFTLTGSVLSDRTEAASLMAEQPWGQVAAILADHGVTLAEVVRCDGTWDRLPVAVNDVLRKAKG